MLSSKVGHPRKKNTRSQVITSPVRGFQQLGGAKDIQHCRRGFSFGREMNLCFAEEGT